MDAECWISELPARLVKQRAVLKGLLVAADAEPFWRWLELSCSVARGAGDELSDLDVALGAADETWEAALEALPSLATGLGDVVEMITHEMAGWAAKNRRMFVQYQDGVQLDLVVMPATARLGLPPGSIALYDPDGRLERTWEPEVFRGSSTDVFEWAFSGWVAIGNLVKYLIRGSEWEAYRELEVARESVWKLWAVLKGADYPAFGLASVLDLQNPELPSRCQATVPRSLVPDDIYASCLTCAELLRDCSERAATVTNAVLPTSLATYVNERLRSRPHSGQF